MGIINIFKGVGKEERGIEKTDNRCQRYGSLYNGMDNGADAVSH